MRPTALAGCCGHTEPQPPYCGNRASDSEKHSLLTLDADILLRSLSIVALLIDKDLRLCNYTRAAASFMHLEEGDLGRPLSCLESLGQEDISALATKVISDGVTLGSEILYKESTLLHRIHPYMNDKGDAKGALLTYIDVSEQARPARSCEKRGKRPNMPRGPRTIFWSR